MKFADSKSKKQKKQKLNKNRQKQVISGQNNGGRAQK